MSMMGICPICICEPCICQIGSGTLSLSEAGASPHRSESAEKSLPINELDSLPQAKDEIVRRAQNLASEYGIENLLSAIDALIAAVTAEQATDHEETLELWREQDQLLQDIADELGVEQPDQIIPAIKEDQRQLAEPATEIERLKKELRACKDPEGMMEARELLPPETTP